VLLVTIRVNEHFTIIKLQILSRQQKRTLFSLHFSCSGKILFLFLLLVLCSQFTVIINVTRLINIRVFYGPNLIKMSEETCIRKTNHEWNRIKLPGIFINQN